MIGNLDNARGSEAEKSDASRRSTSELKRRKPLKKIKTNTLIDLPNIISPGSQPTMSQFTDINVIREESREESIDSKEEDFITQSNILNKINQPNRLP